ncbi:hypothetical protein IGJ28_003346 [Enterococcus sp. AZ091]|uniref:ArsR family transcriptional regulator n=1 Tax=Enterococcus sp. AZ091 TaxID=2774720 RepID=UPI003F28866C
MNLLLYNYYIDPKSKYMNKYKILCLLHELRIASRKQLLNLMNTADHLCKNNFDKNIKYLEKMELIDSIIDKTKSGIPKYYFLTKKGYDSIGGYYSLPKVPEYNLQHHLQINDYLIKMLKICEGHPHLNAVISERRQVYETKDFTKKTKGKKYFVADFIFRFRDKELADINWSFEIELTLKTKRRYREGIFPKYIRELKRREEARLIYVTPSPIIKDELWKFKDYFIYENGKEHEKIFDRLHIFTANEFEEEMIRLVKEDRFINW